MHALDQRQDSLGSRKISEFQMTSIFLLNLAFVMLFDFAFNLVQAYTKIELDQD